MRKNQNMYDTINLPPSCKVLVSKPGSHVVVGIIVHIEILDWYMNIKGKIFWKLNFVWFDETLTGDQNGRWNDKPGFLLSSRLESCLPTFERKDFRFYQKLHNPVHQVYVNLSWDYSFKMHMRNQKNSGLPYISSNVGEGKCVIHFFVQFMSPNLIWY